MITKNYILPEFRININEQSTIKIVQDIVNANEGIKTCRNPKLRMKNTRIKPVPIHGCNTYKPAP